MKEMRIVVTGAAGKFGTAVCKQLESEEADFLAVDKQSNSDSGTRIKVADLLVREAAYEILDGADAVIHLANHPHWMDVSPQVVLNENVAMNMNVFQAAAELGVKRMVFASSIQAIDGEAPFHDREKQTSTFPYFPADSDTPLHPRNPYALSKVLSERMLDYFSEMFDMTCVSIRFPWLVEKDKMEFARQYTRGSRNPYDAFAYLPIESGADLACRCVRADLSGHTSYFPAAKDSLSEMTILEIASELLIGVELRKNPEEMDTLVDCSRIERETGWKQP